MGVGMVHFHQHLVTRFERALGKGRLDVEHGERLLASRGGAGRGVGAARAGTALLPVRAAVLAIDAEIIAHPRLIGRPVALPELPAWPLPDRVTADFGFDLAFAHPGVIIPRSVVGPDMVETEPEV